MIKTSSNRTSHNMAPPKASLLWCLMIATLIVPGLTQSNPTDCSGYDGFYANPSACDKFFRCVSGIRYDFDCAPGTHFNPSNSVCDWPSNAGCSQRQTPPEQIEPQLVTQPYIQYDGASDSGRYYEQPQEYGTLSPHTSEPRYPQYPQVEQSRSELPIYSSPANYQTAPPGYIAVGEYRQQEYVQPTRTFPRQPVFSQRQDNQEIDMEDTQATTTKPVGDSYVAYERPNRVKAGAMKTAPTKGAKSGRIVAGGETRASDANQIEESKPTSHDLVESLPKCEMEQARVCTLDNYDWLSIADTEIASSPAKLYKLQSSSPADMNDTVRREVLAQVARQCEHYCSALLQSRSSNYSISCVGYTYTMDSCRLFTQLEMEIDWLPRLLEHDSPSLKSLKPSEGATSRLQLPQQQLVKGKWLLTQAQAPGDYFDYLKGNNQRYKEVKAKNGDKPITLAACLQACDHKGKAKCKQFVFSSFEGKCYRRKEVDNKQKEADQDLQADQDEEKHKILVADVISGENVEPANLQQKKQDKNEEQEEDRRMKWHFYEESNPEMLGLMQDLITSSSNIAPIDKMNNVTDPKKCRQACLDTWADEDEDKGCRFVALMQDTNQTYACHLYSQRMIETATKLLERRLNEEKESFVIRNSTVAKLSTSGESDKTNHAKREIRSLPTTEMKAFVFYDRPAIRHDIVHDHETISDAIHAKQSLMHWSGMNNEDKCFQECHEMFTTSNDQRCTFLLVQKVSNGYNCTFYDIDNTITRTGAHTHGGRGETFEIHSYPGELPAQQGKAREYFNALPAQDDTQADNKRLVPFHTINNVIDVNECLHHCLKLWVEADDKDNNKCHRVKAIQAGPRQLGRAIRYNCTLIDVIETQQNTRKDGNHTVESLLESPEALVLFKLEHLPKGSISMGEYPALFNWSRADEQSQLVLTHYRASYVLDHQSDYRNCLKVCVDDWMRLRMGDVTRTQRCRLVVVEQSLAKPKQNQIEKTLYQCKYYDLENLDQLSSNQTKKDAKIFMVNKTYLRHDVPLPSNMNAPMLKSLENRSYAFFHTSHVASAMECMQLCLLEGSRGEDKCHIAVALPMTRLDESFNSNMTEYTCALYDINLEVKFTPKPSNASREDERLAYQLQHQPKQAELDDPSLGQYFSKLDGQSDLVSVTMRLYRPVRHVIILSNNNQTNETQPGELKYHNDPESNGTHRVPSPIVAQCLIECLRYNLQLVANQSVWQSLKQSVDKTAPGDCSLVTIASGTVKHGRAVDYDCEFYNINVTRLSRTDLDNPSPLVAYQLNTTDMASLITTEYQSRFYQINSTRTLSELIASQRPIRYVSGVNATKNCLKACFYTWPMSLVTGEQRRCRFVTIRKSKLGWSPQGMLESYDCALYESGTTTRLHSIQVLVRPPSKTDANDEDDDDDDNQLKEYSSELTSRGTEYKHLTSWPMVLPGEDVPQVSQPGTIQDCQQECDNSTSECKAVLALYAGSRLMECYLVDDQYRVDHNRTFQDNERIEVAVKINDLNRAFVKESQDHEHRDSSPFTAIVDAVRRYEKNTAYVHATT